MRPELLGSLDYGSALVSLVADSTSPGGAGTFGWDDEGTPAGKWDIVRNGRLVGFLGSRETAARVPNTRPGSVRAATWANVPIVRMVNINLEPGQGSLEDLIADTPHGLLLSVNRSWSIDDFRLNFQFGCEVGWRIEHGKLAGMVKNPVYSGLTPTFWRSCDAIAGPEAWRMWGYRYCGKGDPMQLMHVGHGCAPARFRSVEVGSRHAR
jgi:TldD protein